MSKFIKPTLVMSSCFNVEACRHDGEIIRNHFLEVLAPHVNIKRVCPEVAIGLGIPRKTIRLVKGKEDETARLIENETQRDLTKKMNDFSKKYIDSLEGIHGFVLKSKSPTCGFKDAKIYASVERGARTIKGNGLFADQINETYPALPKITDGHLNDYNIREHFLTRIFMIAEFDHIKEQPSIKKLQRFQHKHKMALLAMNEIGMRKLGRLVANAKEYTLDELFEKYRKQLIDVSNKMPTFGSNINVFLHSFGQLSDQLSKEEKEFILNTLEQYKEGHLPLSAPVFALKTLAVRLKKHDLLEQSFFNPFPEELHNVRDSGKSRI